MKKIHNACVVCCFTNFQTQEPNTKLNLDYFKRNKLSSTLENLENIPKILWKELEQETIQNGVWRGVGRFIFVGKKSMQKQWLQNVALNLKLELLFGNPTCNPKE